MATKLTTREDIRALVDRLSARGHARGLRHAPELRAAQVLWLVVEQGIPVRPIEVEG
jgi:hypothetical protein